MNEEELKDFREQWDQIEFHRTDLIKQWQRFGEDFTDRIIGNEKGNENHWSTDHRRQLIEKIFLNNVNKWNGEKMSSSLNSSSCRRRNVFIHLNVFSIDFDESFSKRDQRLFGERRSNWFSPSNFFRIGVSFAQMNKQRDENNSMINGSSISHLHVADVCQQVVGGKCFSLWSEMNIEQLFEIEDNSLTRRTCDHWIDWRNLPWSMEWITSNEHFDKTFQFDH